MTEAQDAKPSVDTDKSWSVDGAETSPSSPSEGLGDTVVKMPKISARGAGVKPTMGSGKASTAEKSSGSKPSIPKPVRKGSSEDLMAAFDKPEAAAGSAKSAAPAAAPRPAAPVADAAPAAAATTSVSVASVVRPPAAKPVAPGAKPPASGPAASSAPSARRTRKARLRVARLDPWSVMKTVFLFSIAFGIMAWVATYLLWQVLMASGLFGAINDAIQNAVSSPNNTEGWRIEDYLSANKVLGVTALLAVINAIITTALGTVGAFLYNLSANILGGLELTLAED